MFNLQSKLLLFLFAWHTTISGNNATSLVSSSMDPTIRYPHGTKNEESLTICRHGNDACNIVHKRFWFSNLVEKVCRCVDQSNECPQNWKENDGHTMLINSRAQLKFCQPVSTLPKCDPDEKTLVVQHIGNALKNKLENRIIEPFCNCDKFHYFEKTDFKSSGVNSTQVTYSCKPLSKCQTGQFCGHITEPLYQTYYICTCPQNHLCVMENRIKYEVTEALFSGKAYKGVCIPRQKP